MVEIQSSGAESETREPTLEALIARVEQMIRDFPERAVTFHHLLRWPNGEGKRQGLQRILTHKYPEMGPAQVRRSELPSTARDLTPAQKQTLEEKTDEHISLTSPAAIEHFAKKAGVSLQEVRERIYRGLVKAED